MDARLKMSGMTNGDVTLIRHGMHDRLGMDSRCLVFLRPSVRSGHVPRRISLSRAIFTLGTDPSPWVQDDQLVEGYPGHTLYLSCPPMTI